MENITVAVENFGPIEKGSVVIKPLTIFLGKNNTGKSYLAMLIHTFLESLYEFSIRKGIFHPRYQSPRFAERRLFGPKPLARELPKVETIKNILEELKETFKTKSQTKESIEFGKNLSEGIWNLALRSFESAFKDLFIEELERMFGCTLAELCCHSKKKMRISFELDSLKVDFTCDGNDTALHATTEKSQRIVLKVSHDKGIGWGRHSQAKPRRGQGTTLTVEITADFIKRIQRAGSIKDLGKIFIGSLMDYTMQNFASWELNYSNYLPSARSGILAGHKALASGLLRQLRFVGLERMEFFPLSGPVTDFLANILQIQKRRGEFLKLATYLEETIAEGKVDIKEIERLAYPEIFYEFEQRELSLHRASSMVSELAPLILYLKYLINPKSTLVVEEPESHLHPEAQRKLARLFARLANSNVRTILTSHSDYFLHQIQNLTLLSELDQKNVKLGYLKRELLNSENVSVCLFKRTRDRRTRIKPIDFTDTTLKDSGFNEVIEELYGETVQIERVLKRE